MAEIIELIEGPQLSLDAAFQRIRAGLGLEPHGARVCLNLAFSSGYIRIHADGRVVNPEFFDHHLHVAIQATPDGRWTATIAANTNTSVAYTWTIPAADVERRISEPKKHGGGSPRLYDRIEVYVAASFALHRKGIFRRGAGDYSLNDLAKDTMAELGEGSPHDTQLKEILRPFFNAFKQRFEGSR